MNCTIIVTSTAAKVLEEVLPCFVDLIQSQYSIIFCSGILSWPMCRVDNYVLQVTGEESYITGDIRLLDFKAVRRYVFNVFKCDVIRAT